MVMKRDGVTMRSRKFKLFVSPALQSPTGPVRATPMLGKASIDKVDGVVHTLGPKKHGAGR